MPSVHEFKRLTWKTFKVFRLNLRIHHSSPISLSNISMSCFMNPLPGETRAMGKTYRKQGDFVLGPSMTWVTIDENPASINDGWFVHESKTSFVDYPASYHNSAGGLPFADGHSEIKKWKSPALLTYGKPKTISNAALDSADATWLYLRTTDFSFKWN